MHQYITDTEFAAKNLLILANDEENKLKALTEQLRVVVAQLRVHKWDFESSDLNDDFSDVYVMGAFGRMAKAAQQSGALEAQLTSLQVSIGTHQHAIQAIAGAILQIVKQGISIVHGNPAAAPEGRKIGTVSLKEVVWQARNQAIHYEECNPRKSVTDLFATLEQEQGAHFSLANHPNQSRAKQVLTLLGWSDYAAYLNDMQSLLP